MAPFAGRSLHEIHLDTSHSGGTKENLVVLACVRDQLLGISLGDSLCNDCHDPDGGLLHGLHAGLICTAPAKSAPSALCWQHAPAPLLPDPDDYQVGLLSSFYTVHIGRCVPRKERRHHMQGVRHPERLFMWPHSCKRRDWIISQVGCDKYHCVISSTGRPCRGRAAA